MRNRLALFLVVMFASTLLLTAKFSHPFDLIHSAGAAPVEANGEIVGENSQSETHFAPIKELLALTDTGRTALAQMEQYGVGLKFMPGRGTFYSIEANTMVIDADKSPVKAALSFVHEMNHARYYHQGLRADIHALARDEYVRQKVAEEAHSLALSIDAKTELWKAGVNVFDFNYPLEADYREAYLAAVEAAVAQEEGQEIDELVAIGQEAGMARLFEVLMEGEVLRSSTKIPYPDFFAQDWEKAHDSGPVSQFLGNQVVSVFN
jgi:hypothetical protein